MKFLNLILWFSALVNLSIATLSVWFHHNPHEATCYATGAVGFGVLALVGQGGDR